MKPFFFCNGHEGRGGCPHKFGICSDCKTKLVGSTSTETDSTDDNKSDHKEKEFVANAKKKLKECHGSVDSLEEKNRTYFSFAQVKKHFVLNCSVCGKYHECLKKPKKIGEMIDYLTSKRDMCLPAKDDAKK